jgi:hypothetical protein
MSNIVSKFYPISDIFFKTGKEVILTPGGGLVGQHEVEPMGLHIFNWSPESYITAETWSGQTIKFPPTCFVEGAVYYIKIRRLINAGPNASETQVMAVSTSELHD